MKRTLIAALLVFALLPLAAQGPDPEADRRKLLEAAAGNRISEEHLDSLLARLDRLQSDGLPTGDWVSLVLEGVAKGVRPEILLEATEAREDALRSSRQWIDHLLAQGVRDDYSNASRRPEEDLAGILADPGIRLSDLQTLKDLLQTDRLSSLLAAADSFAHLKAARFPERGVLLLIESLPADTPVEEYRLVVTAVLAQRKRGLSDGAIVQALGGEFRRGNAPSALLKGWGAYGPGGGAGKASGPSQGSADGRGDRKGRGGPKKH